MKDLGLRFHHVGLATAKPRRASSMLISLGYALGEATWDPQQLVWVQMAEHERMPSVELVYPGDEPSPIDGILDRAADGPYHLCFAVADIEATVDRLKDEGHRLLVMGEPCGAALFEGRRILFLRIHGFGLIELVEEPSAADQ